MKRISDKVNIDQGELRGIDNIEEINAVEVAKCWKIVNDPKWSRWLVGN